MGLHHAFSLGGCGERQEDIAGCLSGWRHERVESYNKLHCVVDSLHPSLGFCRRARQKVVPAVKAHLDRIRIARLHCPEGQITVRVEDKAAISGVLIGANHLLDKVFAEALFKTETSLVKPHCFIADSDSARNIDIPADCHKGNQAVADLHAISLLIKGESPRY